jgi:hypothetical protein
VSTPHTILARQVKLAKHLQYLASFRHLGPRVIPGPPLPISDEDVAKWIADNEFTRGALAPHIARALAFINTFRRAAP